MASILVIIISAILAFLIAIIVAVFFYWLYSLFGHKSGLIRSVPKTKQREIRILDSRAGPGFWKPTRRQRTPDGGVVLWLDHHGEKRALKYFKNELLPEVNQDFNSLATDNTVKIFRYRPGRTKSVAINVVNAEDMMHMMDEKNHHQTEANLLKVSQDKRFKEDVDAVAKLNKSGQKKIGSPQTGGE